ncbi:MAG: hypothetical protein PT934_01945 [Peptoniphilaceae bacterium]|uniref:hypothetical protein n=1 Tax=Parvimonas sp. TaxID=1944660 RepID=UPI0025E296B1|nr:hypothetical protein [Parvimonas sp.]MCI5997664.1 hypothetical protein [Parvimonas sp.]MDD7764510.1 hypothetical protein [Peptoniphilaceae bacterium]MDY3050489.1 hypothetical protein [Parvimonas sp.]
MRKIFKYKILYWFGILLSVLSFLLIDMKNLLRGQEIAKYSIGILLDLVLFFICLDKISDKK